PEPEEGTAPGEGFPQRAAVPCRSAALPAIMRGMNPGDERFGPTGPQGGPPRRTGPPGPPGAQGRSAPPAPNAPAGTDPLREAMARIARLADTAARTRRGAPPPRRRARAGRRRGWSRRGP